MIRKRKKIMLQINNIEELDYDKISVAEEWNESKESELIMHTIHSYPAKFPACNVG